MKNLLMNLLGKVKEAVQEKIRARLRKKAMKKAKKLIRKILCVAVLCIGAVLVFKFRHPIFAALISRDAPGKKKCPWKCLFFKKH